MSEGRDKFDPDVLRRDAAHLLRVATDPVTLVASLLRTIRSQHDEGEHIREGYGHSQKLLQEDHRAYLEGVRGDLARELRREIRRQPPSGQHLTYAGGLRRAARIAGGWWM